MADTRKLNAMHQLRTNMQTLDATDLSTEQKDKAFENLFDAYNIYMTANPKLPNHPAEELRKHLTASVSFTADSQNLQEATQKIAHLQTLLSSDIVSKDNTLKEQNLIPLLNKLLTQLNAAQKTKEQIKQIEETMPKVCQSDINALLKKASKTANREQKDIKEQKKANQNLEKLKASFEKLFAQKQKQPLEETHITQIGLLQESGKQYVLITDDKGNTHNVLVQTHHGKQIFSGNMDSKREMSALFKALEQQNPIVFNDASSEKAPKSKKGKGYTSKNFFQDLNIDLAKEKTPDLASELAGYNTLLATDPQSAFELKQKLKEKYTFIFLNQQKDKLTQKLSATETDIKNSNKEIRQNTTQFLSSISPQDLLRLAAPATGQNKDEEKNRQHFTDFINLICSSTTLSDSRNKMLHTLRDEDILWKNINTEYYKQIKECAQDPYYQTLTEQIFNSQKTPQQVLNETSADLSPDLAKKILTRSVITYGLGNPKTAPHPTVTNKIIDVFGYQIDFTPVTVETQRETTSKELTYVMRCLADGHPLDISTLSQADQVRFKKHKDELQTIFATEENYQPLVGNILNNSSAGQTKEISPYQKNIMQVGLLAALDPEMSKNIDFSEALKNTLPADKQKNWDLDDYLFTKYMSLYFNQDISPTEKEKIKKLKEGYDWNGFKQKHKEPTHQIYQDFNSMTKKTQTIIFNALTEGKLESSTHHLHPLKYAIFSKKPATYNDTLVTSVQARPWHEDLHQLHHLATVEGTDTILPYCVKTENGFTRRGQKDLRKGDIVFFESLQVKDKNGQYQNLIPENCFYLSSNSGIIMQPQPTPKAIAYHNQRRQGSGLEI